MNINQSNSNSLGNLSAIDHFYHSVSSTDLNDLVSISKNGITLRTAGETEEKTQRVVKNIYAFGEEHTQMTETKHERIVFHKNFKWENNRHFGCVISRNGIGKDFPTIQRFSTTEEIPIKDILGITVPHTYSTRLEDFNLGRLNSLDFMININSLKKFFSENLGIDLLDDVELKKAYEATLRYSPYDTYIIDSSAVVDTTRFNPHREMQRIENEFNQALVSRIKNIYNNLFEKESYTFADIIHFHTKLPVYSQTGEVLVDGSNNQYKLDEEEFKKTLASQSQGPSKTDTNLEPTERNFNFSTIHFGESKSWYDNIEAARREERQSKGSWFKYFKPW